MLVRHFMTRRVLSLDRGVGCRAALTLLKQNGFRRAPVLRGTQLVGMVSERDLLRVLAGTAGVSDGLDVERAPVAAAMAREVITLHPEEHLEDAARKMLVHKIGGMPVIRNARLVGVLTESDIFRAFARMANSSGVLRISLARTQHSDADADPARIALQLGFHLRGYLVHESPDGEELAVLRVRGDHKDELVERLSAAGFNVLEIDDARYDASDREVA